MNELKPYDYLFQRYFRKRLLFNYTVKIINTTLKSLLKVPKQKATFNLYKHLYSLSLWHFKSALWFCFKIKFLKIFFMICVFVYIQKNVFLYLVLCSNQIWSYPFKDTQRAFKHSRHSKSTWAFGGHSGTQRLLGGN